MVTASRIGGSPITIDWSNLPHQETDPVELEKSWGDLKKRFSEGEVGFFEAPSKNEISQLKESQDLAKKILDRGTINDVLFLGIGGSSLGPMSLLTALDFKRTNQVRFHFVDNPDPITWKKTIDHLNPENTLVCSVTKSGGTFETMSQTLIALDWLGKDRWKTNLVAITDPKKGDLRKFADKYQIPNLAIHPSLGGRFSIFSPVGLFAAELAGLDAQKFVDGASKVQKSVEKNPPVKQPLFNLGVQLVKQFDQRSVHVCMPYSTQLKFFGEWWVQLWGESLGKDKKGFSPIAAVGATDQHSLLQLLRDGPDDKVTCFIKVNEVPDSVAIPSLPDVGMHEMAAFSALAGHSLSGLLETEYQAIAKVLTNQNRPHFTLQVDQLNEEALGALYFSFCVITAFTGTYWELNPFDQPGVEEGKVYIRESLAQAQPHSEHDSDGHSAVDRLRKPFES